MISTLTTTVRRVEPLFGPNQQWVERLRQNVWYAAEQRFGDSYTFVRHKGTADYVCTTAASPAEIAQTLYAEGYQRNILSTVKTRNKDKQYVHSAWVLDAPDTEWQQDVFIWENKNGTTDVYSHKEPSVRRPKAHLDLSTGTHGDPDKRVRNTLDAAGIGYTTVDTDKLK